MRQHLQSSGGETLCRGAGRFADSLHPDDARETDGEEIAGACKRVLIVAEAPGLEDFPDPVLPRGSSAEQVRLGLEREARALRERGYTVDLALARAEVTAADDLAAALAGKAYDCIVVGGGLRAEPGMTLAFEAVMNVLRERAPNARLAFNRAPGGAADAVERQLRRAEPSSRLRG